MNAPEQLEVGDLAAKQRELEIARSQAKDAVRWGAVWVIGGALASWITYQMATGGGTYLMFWGAIGYGVLRLGLGVQASLRATRLRREVGEVVAGPRGLTRGTLVIAAVVAVAIARQVLSDGFPEFGPAKTRTACLQGLAQEDTRAGAIEKEILSGRQRLAAMRDEAGRLRSYLDDLERRYPAEIPQAERSGYDSAVAKYDGLAREYEELRARHNARVGEFNAVSQRLNTIRC